MSELLSVTRGPRARERRTMARGEQRVRLLGALEELRRAVHVGGSEDDDALGLSRTLLALLVLVLLSCLGACRLAGAGAGAGTSVATGVDWCGGLCSGRRALVRGWSRRVLDEARAAQQAESGQRAGFGGRRAACAADCARGAPADARSRRGSRATRGTARTPQLCTIYKKT